METVSCCIRGAAGVDVSVIASQSMKWNVTTVGFYRRAGQSVDVMYK